MISIVIMVPQNPKECVSIVFCIDATIHVFVIICIKKVHHQALILRTVLTTLLVGSGRFLYLGTPFGRSDKTFLRCTQNCKLKHTVFSVMIHPGTLLSCHCVILSYLPSRDSTMNKEKRQAAVVNDP